MNVFSGTKISLKPLSKSRGPFLYSAYIMREAMRIYEEMTIVVDS